MSKIIFVTGATGFVGSHVVDQLLKGGYKVRATARGAKADALKAAYAGNANFEVVTIADISTDQFPEALKGVYGVIHVASPLPGRADGEGTFKTAVEGSLNLLNQAEKAGITRIVVTASSSSVEGAPSGTYTDKDWNPLTKEAALASGDVMAIYGASKTAAEKATWEWADAHPNVEVTTINGPFFYGPLTESFKLPKPDFIAISTNIFIYNVVVPYGHYPPLAWHTDVRDIAKAHILALDSPPTAKVGRKRILIASPHNLNAKNIKEILLEKRPELKDRLVQQEPTNYAQETWPIDFARVEEVLGFKKEQFHKFEQTLLDTVDNYLKVEAEWKSKGFEIQVPPY